MLHRLQGGTEAQRSSNLPTVTEMVSSGAGGLHAGSSTPGFTPVTAVLYFVTQLGGISDAVESEAGGGD